MNEADYYNGYVKRKSGEGSAYNYDLFPLINNFSFYDFIVNADGRKEDLIDHGAVLIITNKQYILGYTAGFGYGSHVAAFARVMKELHGGGDITSFPDVMRLENACNHNYLTARIIYEYLGDDNYGRPMYSGRINFNLNTIDNTITPEQFEVFKKFYADYNDEIKRIVAKLGMTKFYVRFAYTDEYGHKQEMNSSSLDLLYAYLESHVDSHKIIDDADEVIIGKPLNNQTLN